MTDFTPIEVAVEFGRLIAAVKAKALREAVSELGAMRRAGAERYAYGLSLAENYLANLADDTEAAK